MTIAACLLQRVVTTRNMEGSKILAMSILCKAQSMIPMNSIVGQQSLIPLYVQAQGGERVCVGVCVSVSE